MLDVGVALFEKQANVVEPLDVQSLVDEAMGQGEELARGKRAITVVYGPCD